MSSKSYDQYLQYSNLLDNLLNMKCTQYDRINYGIARVVVVLKLARMYTEWNECSEKIQNGEIFIDEMIVAEVANVGNKRQNNVTNCILYNGKIKRECVDDNFKIIVNARNIESIYNDFC